MTNILQYRVKRALKKRIFVSFQQTGIFFCQIQVRALNINYYGKSG
jgi:hypothetical protein